MSVLPAMRKICCESHGGPVGLHCNHDHCTGPKNVYEGKVETDPETGDSYLVFPDGLTEEMGWNIGDTLLWKENSDGSWSLTKDGL